MKRLPSQIGFQCFPRKFKLLRGLAQAVMKRVRNLTYVGAVCAFVYLSHSVWQEPLVLTGWLAYSSPPVVLRAFVYLCLGTVSYLPLNPVFVRLGCCIKIPQAGWLKPQKFASCQFWRLEVWDWGVSRSVLFKNQKGSNCFRSFSWLLRGHLFPVTSHHQHFIHDCIQIFSYFKDTIVCSAHPNGITFI